MSLRLSRWLLLIVLASPQLSVCQTTLTVAAASDLTNVQSDLAATFRKFEPTVQVRFVNGASAMLAQQIDNGAPYDVFLSANAAFIDRLGSFRKVLPESIESYATGRVGVLWRDRKHHSLNDLTENWVRFVALPNPRLAPYGVAAQQALEHAKVWDKVKPKIVYGENVRQTLQLFDSGNADVVLTSDSLLQGRNAELLPADWHQAIIQQGGIVASSHNQSAAKHFLAFLIGPVGQSIFAKYGFGSPKP